MIVSEEPFLRDMVCTALNGLDAEIRCPDTEALARNLSDAVAFDLIIILTVTPFSYCCQTLPYRKRGVAKPVVYVIAWQQSEQTVLSLLESGVGQYMTFPVNLQRLRKKVADELDRISL